MSNDKLNKIKNNFCETDNINKSHGKLDKDKEELINPLSLLSSDLLKEINNIDEKNTVGKKESSIDNNLQSDSDTQKESYENEEEVLLLKHIVISHHEDPEYGSPRRPQIIEALIVHLVDVSDAKLQPTIEALNKVKVGELTEQIYVNDRDKFYKHKLSK